MTENNPTATPDVKPAEEKVLSSDELKAMFDNLPEQFRDAIGELNKSITEHNSKVDTVKAAESNDPKLIKAEIFEQNPSNNRKLARLLVEYRKFEESMEKLRADAYKIIDTDGLMPKEATPEELERLKGEVTSSTKELREQVQTIQKLEEMMPMFKGKLSIHLDEIKTRRGAAKTSTSGKGDTGILRPRFKKIEINGVTQDDKGNKVSGTHDGKDKYTFTFASQYLRKQHKGINWSSADLTNEYIKGLDPDNLPEVHEFVMPYVFKDENGNEKSVNYTIKTYR